MIKTSKEILQQLVGYEYLNEDAQRDDEDTLRNWADTKDDMADSLRRIADMIDRGMTSGYYPTWRIKGEEELNEKEVDNE